jgi:3',5'-nucleoside bisphosphate phosphatase
LKALTPHLVLAPDAAIDLQMHTTYSDGRWVPSQLIDYLVSERFDLVAITDHDRVDTIITLQQLAAEKQLPLLAAVEMSTSWKGEPTDLLCYGVDPDNNELNALAQDVARGQRENTRKVYENLRRKGYSFPNPQESGKEDAGEPESHHELMAIIEKPSAQQPHELVALLKKHGYGTGEPSAGKMITDAGFFWVTIDIAAVVDAVHHSGGVCLIAHPGRGGGYTCYDVSLLDQLRKAVPIDGFEVYYPAHTPEQIAMYLQYAQKHGLLISSGSDSHGPDNKPIKYRAELSRSLLERVGIQIK